MGLHIKFFLLVLFLISTERLCNAVAVSPLFTEHQHLSLQSNAVATVLNRNGTPLSGAQVLLSTHDWGMTLATDAAGAFEWPQNMPARVDVTIRAEGYLPATFTGFEISTDMQFVLRALDPVQIVWLGKTTGYGQLRNDNWLDFSFVLPSVKREDLLNLTPQHIASPLKDVITVMSKKVSLPSNVSLPRQSENYGIFPVTIEKIQFRCLAPASSSQTFYATRGRLRFKQVVDALMGGKSFMDVLKDVELQGVGQTTASQPNQPMEIAIDQVPLTYLVKLPRITVPADKQWTTIAVFEENSNFALSDVKLLNDVNPAALVAPAENVKRSLLHILRPKDQKSDSSMDFWQLSIAQQPENAPVPTPLELIPAPQRSGTTITSKAPARTRSTQALGTLINLWLVREVSYGNEKYLASSLWWQTYDTQWNESWKLPDQILVDIPTGAKLRTEVVYLATQGTRQPIRVQQRADTSDLLSTATHASKHSSMD